MNAFILAMSKHLSLSPSALRLLDVNGASEATLRAVRQDVDTLPVAADRGDWAVPESVDAVVAYNMPLESGLLRSALAALRPGGRLIMGDPNGAPDESLVQTLELAGYTRILVEPAHDGVGLCMHSGEPHTTDSTLERIQFGTDQDEASGLSRFKGRYIHLLIRQTPNKPVWRLEPGETVKWEAVAVSIEGGDALLAFSSLPNDVGFMQPAVLANKLKDVHKVAKFSLGTAEAWAMPVLLNPPAEVLERYEVWLIEIDPTTAEASDE